MDFESIYKMNEAVQESEQLADDMPQDITVSEEALNIAMNQISLIIDGFKKDNYIQQMMQFYDNKPKKESSEQEPDMEHLTEAKKGTFAFYYKLLIKSNSNMAKKIKIAAIILVLLAVILGVTVAVNWDKIKNSMNSVKTKKLADSTAANLTGNTGMLNGAANIAGAAGNPGVDANAAQASTNAKEELTNNQVNDTKPMSNLGGMTTHQWVQSKKDAGLSKEQIEDEYEKEGYSRHGPKFIAAMTAIFGGVSIATLTAVSPTTSSATGVTTNNQSAVINTNTYTADIVPPEEKQQKEAEIKQEIEQNPEAAEQVANEMKTEEKAEGAEESQMDKEGTEGKAESEAEIDWSNPSAVWSNAVQTGNGEIRPLKGDKNGFVLYIPNQPNLIWSQNKNGGPKFETYQTSDNGNTVVIDNVQWTYINGKYEMNKSSAVLHDNGQPLSLPEFIMRASQQHATEDQQVSAYVKNNKGNAYYKFNGGTSTSSWGAKVNQSGNDKIVTGSTLWMGGSPSRISIMEVTPGSILGTFNNEIYFFQNGKSIGDKDQAGIPMGQRLSMADITDCLIRASKMSGVNTAVTIGASASMGVGIGTAICPGLGTIIGGIFGTLFGTLMTGITNTNKTNNIFGVLAWSTMGQVSQQKLINHVADSFAFSESDVSGMNGEEKNQKLQIVKNVIRNNGASIIQAGNPSNVETINCVLCNMTNAIVAAVLGTKNNGNPYQTAAERFVQQSV